MRELEGARGLAHTHTHAYACTPEARADHPPTHHSPAHSPLTALPPAPLTRPLTTHHALHHPPRNSPKPYTLGHACPHPVMPALVTLSYSCMHARTTNTQYICTHTWRAHTHTHHAVMPAPTRSCLPPRGHACPHSRSHMHMHAYTNAQTRAHAPEAHAPEAH